MTDNLLAVLQLPAEPSYNPYELLGKPTLEITDAQLEIIVEELRARRRSFQLGVQDKAPRAKKIAGPKVPAVKTSVSLSLLDEL